MTVLTAANPVGEAIFGLLQDATLQASVDGRVYDSIPQDTIRPCILYEVLGETDRRGMGTGGLPELDLRTHVFSDVGSLSEAHSLNQSIVALLKDAAITVTGYTQAGLVTYRETVTLRDQELFGAKVHEVVSLFTVWVENS